MKLTNSELAFLAAWAREEWEPACYQLPAHKLQLSHGVSGALLIEIIKAWIETNGMRDQDIQMASSDRNFDWPWSSIDEFQSRLDEAVCQRV